MKRLLVTGATGALGSEVVHVAEAAGRQVRSMSRHAKPTGSEADWAQADVLTGEGLEAAVRDVQTIIHCASNSQHNALEVERDGTANLLAAARRGGVEHVVYISIVGIDGSDYGYYRAKLAGEAAMAAGGVPYTTVRMTQFHSLIDILLEMFLRRWALVVPWGWRFQPLAPAEAAAVLVSLAGRPAAGRVADVGGPEVRTMRDMAAAWLAIKGERKPILPIPTFDALSRAWRSGANLVPGNPYGEIRWEDWLREKYER